MKMQSFQERNCNNCNKMIFPGAGKYDMPIITPEDIDVDDMISFNDARRSRNVKDPQNHVVHFYLYDYQFNCVWDRPDRYTYLLKKYKAVLTPGYSMYTDFPKAVQIYNSYRRHWMGAYWQLNGLHVIPTIGWSDKDSYSWCFDGEPEGATVAVSSVGTQADSESKKYFIDGYNEMLARLQPKKIIIYGLVPDGCRGNIINIKPFQNKFRKEQEQ